MKITKKTRSKKPLIITALLIVIAAGIGVFTYFQLRDVNPPTEPTVQTEAEDEVRSEGSSFPIPEDVPEESIVDYRLDHETAEYKIRYDESRNTYVVTLYAIINRPDQYDLYLDQLRDYKQQALDYMSSNNINVNEVEIEYEPEEAADL